MGISSEGIKFFPQFFGTDLLSLNFSNLWLDTIWLFFFLFHLLLLTRAIPLNPVERMKSTLIIIEKMAKNPIELNFFCLDY